MSTDQQPLEAMVFKRNSLYVVSVSGTELGEVADFVAATNLLCSQAAQYRRRVVVQVALKNKFSYLEISEDGEVARASAPTHSGFAAAQTIEGLPGSSPTIATPTGKPRLDATGSAGGGFLDAPAAAEPIAATLSWKLRRHAPTIVKAAALVVLTIGCGVLSMHNYTAAEQDKERQARWETVEPATAAALRQTRDQALPSAQTLTRAVNTAAERHGVTVVVGEPVPTMLTYRHALGQASFDTQLREVTATGGDLVGFTSTLSKSQVSIVEVTRTATGLTLLTRSID